MVWDIYIDTGSLRKTIEALPDDHKGVLDLKNVHDIMKKYRRNLKEKLKAVY